MTVKKLCSGLIILLVLCSISSLICAQFVNAAPTTSVYDFIVVGGGTAGCVVASRLSENGNHTVLLVHDGGFPIPEIDVPALIGIHLTDPTITTRINTVPQDNAARVNNGAHFSSKTISHILGKVLGGSSAINGMWWNRGHPKDYNAWADVTGDSSWSYENMLDIFKRLETYNGTFHSDQHGYEGKVPIQSQSYAPGMTEFLEAGRELGYPYADPNGPQISSVTIAEYNRKMGRRVSSFKAYLEPVMFSRPNLHVILNAQVKRIIFQGRTAVGVKYSLKNEPLKTARVRKEMILSTGAIDSPAILMKSGIGPKHILESAGIPLIKSLPVGQNLQDHITLQLSIIINNESAIFDPKRDLTPENWRLYNKIGDGPYSSLSGATHQAFIASTGSSNWPDIHLVAASSEYGISGMISFPNARVALNLTSWERLTSCIILCTRPLSRGHVTLNQTNVDAPPVIDFRYFSHSHDMNVMLQGIDMVSKIFEQTNAHRRLLARFVPGIAACSQFAYRSQEYWKCHVRQLSTTGRHVVGTCRMGKVHDPRAVVDSKLRVIGVDRLRVVDASIMPNVVNTNTQVAVFAIAEKVSDMILQKWMKPTFTRKRFNRKNYQVV